MTLSANNSNTEKKIDSCWRERDQQIDAYIPCFLLKMTHVKKKDEAQFVLGNFCNCLYTNLEY